MGGTIKTNPLYTPDMLQWCHLNESEYYVISEEGPQKFYNAATVKNKHIGSASQTPKESLYPHVLAHLSYKFIWRKSKKDGGHLKNIKVYYETHSLDGNPHLTFRVLCVSNCKPEGESSSLPAPLCRLTAQCDFYCPVFGVPAREVSKASRVTKSISVSTGPISAWPHKAAHWAFMVDTMSLLFRGLKRDGGGVEPWGHPGRPPLNSTRAMWQQGTMSMHYVNNILQHPLFTSAIERCVPFVPTTNIVGSSGAI